MAEISKGSSVSLSSCTVHLHQRKSRVVQFLLVCPSVSVSPIPSFLPPPLICFCYTLAYHTSQLPSVTSSLLKTLDFGVNRKMCSMPLPVYTSCVAECADTGTELSYENFLELSSGLEGTPYLISNSCLQRFAKTRKIIKETMCAQLDLAFLSFLPLFSDLGSRRRVAEEVIISCPYFFTNVMHWFCLS